MPYDRNVPEVPCYKATEIIKAIEKRVMRLDENEKSDIGEIVFYHECEASVIAEKVSELLNVSYQSIFDLL